METLLVGSVCVSLTDVAFRALEPIGIGSGRRNSGAATAPLPIDGPVSSALTECETVVDGAWVALDESSCNMHMERSTLRTKTHNWGA